jgi:hypothetical protein
MNDVRMELTNTAMYNIRRAAFVIKTLGKGYYPEAILGNPSNEKDLIAVQKMEMMHRERVSHNSIHKSARTWWRDPLIVELTRMAVSPYVDVRRSVQTYTRG